MEESNPELESFRQQWRAEVSARSQGDGNKNSKSSNAGPSKPTRRPPPITRLASERAKAPMGEEDYIGPQNIFEPSGSNHVEGEETPISKSSSKEPQTALEHYERAVERETQGSLGDSLILYRKAFRMDHQVDQKYKSKHFPPSSFTAKLQKPNPSDASVTVPNTAHHSLDGLPQSIKELIAGFAGLSMQPAPPEIEGTPTLPCPLADLPDEISIQIYKEVAILDVASFVRLAQVCKRLCYIVATEEQIWRRICLGSEVGFGAMHYQWQREVLGGPLQEEIPELDSDSNEDSTPEQAVIPLTQNALTEALYRTVYTSSWHLLFRLRPRIRFNGCYISTVNYIRPGQATSSQVTWQSPVLIVTYFRYLRFFRDGTVISLLTTTEPKDVVPYLTKELQETHRNGASPYLPSAVMRNALRGRWRLSTIGDNPVADLKDSEGNVFIETEGASPRYIYRMKLSLRSAGKGPRNNKLVWQGFWSYNLLTDDSGEFTLRNDKAFFWSRVKSYGVGA